MINISHSACQYLASAAFGRMANMHEIAVRCRWMHLRASPDTPNAVGTIVRQRTAKQLTHFSSALHSYSNHYYLSVAKLLQNNQE